ncbi:hypothetical protein SAMN05660653_00166 [Desulfonatronum thiosulfatophilum]|uniref:Uncharacterized protein n=1 Tax=Desulfonatronum thiosulfatophilum TaxID=617002 RepID=A0A1G6A5S5_9BACT|nr:hypothetical protein [Desulfonatronum thiosulfatophilum]SDB03660.1 hypothetical protein SAMN05660653_00166 [Desulfonatronum thiosulfatophilum]
MKTDEQRIVENRDMAALMSGLTAMYHRPDAKALLRHARRTSWKRGLAVISAHIGGDVWMEFVDEMRGDVAWP